MRDTLALAATLLGSGRLKAVAGDAELPVAEVDELLGDLVARSMVTVESGAFGRRFRLLETMRQFGAEHLFEVGGSERIAARHAAYVRDEVLPVITARLLGERARPVEAVAGVLAPVMRLSV